MAFMKCQLQHGLEVRAIAPADHYVPAERRQPIEHLPIQEMNVDSPDFCVAAMAVSPGPGSVVFHFHGISPWSGRLARNLKKARIPYVFTSHGHLHFHGTIHGFKKFVYLNMVNPFIRDAGGLHFLTLREQKRCRFLLPAWRKPTLVQSNLVQLPDAAAIEARSRGELGISPGTFVFAYLGRLDVNHKGLDLLVDGFARISGAADACLLLIGPDSAGAQKFLEERARQLGCEKRIHFLGSQIGDTKWRTLKMADAFVSPSRWEACSIAQAEAIGFGIPTILSTAANVAPEAVKQGAVLASPLSPASLAQAMQRLVDDGGLRRSLAEAGRWWIANTCSYEEAGARFEEFYQAVVSMNQKGRGGK